MTEPIGILKLDDCQVEQTEFMIRADIFFKDQNGDTWKLPTPRIFLFDLEKVEK
ncbi:MAG: hypothetical protein JEZ11_17880 [Desulfobacterales bacterium]|nr:hypothetical protein [Desulfobacterales bacterium]